MAIRKIKTEAKTYRPYTGEHGLYVSRKLDERSSSRLVDFVHKNGLCTMDDTDIHELHCTIMYSPIPRVDKHDINPIPTPYAGHIIRVEFWPGRDGDGYLVAIVSSPALQNLFRLWSLRGGVSTFPEYKPHITIKTPFEEPKGISNKFLSANNELAKCPMLVRFVSEVVEDIKPSHVIEIALIEAQKVT